MTTTINADNGVVSGSAGLKYSSDSSGELALQTNGTTAVTISSGQVATFAQAPVLPAASIPQAALAAGVAGNGPAFSAYPSATQSLTANVATKLLFQTEEYDTNSNFASSQFTPTVAGYYQINGAYVAAAVGRTYNIIYVYKNGVEYKLGQAGNSTTGVGTSVSLLVYLNGSTDYVEIYGLSGLTQSTSGTASENYFQGFLARSA